ncbi:MAG: ATP-binding protein, partial [Solirubrobacterales bacterium]|nr:ATP-binding protein [Solirubrobacterales bacterium]
MRSPRSQRQWPLVGRAGELELIARARSEGASGVVLVGAAGVGKSRLAREALLEAEQAGCQARSVQATA